MITLNAVLVLARARLLIIRNTFWRRKLWEKIGVLVILFVAGWLSYGLYAISQGAVQVLNDPEFAAILREAAAQNPGLPTDPAGIVRTIPSMLLFVASLVLVLSSFSSVLSSLYLAGDMDMLLTRPVPMRAVFIIKFFSGMLPQYGLLFVLLGPVLLGYGHGLGYGALYLLAMLVTLLLLPLLPIGLGALLVMAVVRIIPARRARDIVSVLGGMVALSFYILSQFTPEVAPYIADIDNLAALQGLNLPLLPSAWAGRALIAAGEVAPLTLLVYGGLFVLLTLLVFVGCLVLAERLYYVGWSNMAIQGGKPRRAAASGSGALALPERPRPWALLLRRWAALDPQSAAVFLKDWRLFPRDMRNVQQLIFPIALAGIWVFRLLTMPQDTGAASAATLEGPVPVGVVQPGTLIGLGITYFLCYTISSAIAGPGISRESRTFWLLKLAPISPLRVLLGKLVLAYLPYPLVGTPLLLLLTLLGQNTVTPLGFVAGWLLLLLLGLGNSCLALGLGATFPRLDWEHPQQQTTWLAGCLGLTLTPLYLGSVALAVFGLPALALLPAASGLVLPLNVLGWAMAFGITVLVVWASLSVGIRGLNRIEL
jgi:ABC-2 type transport system permease protein